GGKSLVGWNRAAGEDEPLRIRHREAYDFERRGREGNADEELGRADAAAGYQANVAGKHEDRAAGDGVAVRRGDDGHRHGEELPHRVAQQREEAADVVGAAVDEAEEIDAGREDRTAPGEDDRAGIIGRGKLALQ